MSALRVAGLVFAGGRGSRLGAAIPKPLVQIDGRPMIAHVIDRFPPSVAPVVIGANDPDAFASVFRPVVKDRISGFHGPLAALDAAWALLKERGETVTHLMTLPGDTPFLPADVHGRLMQGAQDRPRAAACAEQSHPTVALWPPAALNRLESYIAADRDPSVRAFAEHCGGFEAVAFDTSTEAPDGDPFFNVNTPGDLARAREAMARLKI